MMRVVTLLAAVVLLVGCSDMPPTAPTNARMTLAISQASLPVGGTAVVTATIRELNGAPVEGALVSFSGSLGTFAPTAMYSDRGIATTTYTATQPGTGAINAVSGPVSAEQLQVRVGETPPPAINVAPTVPTVSLSCNNGIAGAPTICAVSGANVQSIAINWGDGASEESFGPATASVAHVFGRADRFTVSARGIDNAGRVATAASVATIAPAPEPPAVFTPSPVTTSMSLSQEANAVSGCAAFNAYATPATGTTMSSIAVTKAGVSVAGPFLSTNNARFALCGLVISDILTATATDASGGQSTYQLIVK